jgi:lipoprotein-releasing system permease protein
LLSVVAVAAFNIISTLTMAVTEKRSDIAVLRTMGARASSVMAIFMAHGLLLALSGIALGLLVGITLALNISKVTLFLEKLTGTKLFSPQVYFISDLPSRLMWQDVFVVAGLALLLSLLATLFPAWRATRIAPAEVLRYE